MKLFPLLILYLLPISLYSGEWVRTHYQNNENPEIMVCPDSANCYVFIDDGNKYQRIYKSTNQGKNWVRITNNEDGLTGLASGDAPHPGYLYYGHFKDAVIKWSRDDGKNFMEVSLDSTKRPIWEITMLDTNVGVARCNGMYITTDGWKSTIYIEKPFVFDYSSYFSNLLLINDTTVCFTIKKKDNVTQHFFKYRWNQKGGPYAFITDEKGMYLSDLIFVNDDLGFICGDKDANIGDTKSDVIFRTTDGGRNWIKVLDHYYEGTAFGLQDISFGDENNGIAVGQFGKIMRTTDGGDTWTYDSIPDDMVDPPTMVVTWAGSVPLIGTLSQGLYRYEEGTGVEDVLDTKDIKIKQEGDKLLISIEDESSANYTINIVDLNGKVVFRQSIGSGIGTAFKSINLSNLSSGTYLYSISNGQKIKSGTFNIVR